MGVVSQIFSFVRSAGSAFQRRRCQRLALSELMRLGPERLDALGIDAFAVDEAMRRPAQEPAKDARPVPMTVGERLGHA